MNRDISVLWPTIRPEMCLETFKVWESHIKFKDRVVFNFGVNTKEQAQKLEGKEVLIVGDHIRGVPKALHALIQSCVLTFADNEIIIVASDDFFPPENWDEIVFKEFENFEGCVLFFDGIQEKSEMVTLPIISHSALKQLEYIVYHPVYNHMGSDCELYKNLLELRLLKDLRSVRKDIVFEHRHHTIGKRARDKIDDFAAKVYRDDMALLVSRIAMPLKERLKVE